MRAFNAREGLSREQDYLPQKLFKKALKGGISDGIILEQSELDRAMDSYFEKAGWDVASGIPTRTTLESLDLGWVADDLGL
jgi:aldehyde:ferredoxin oxidoreductase